MNKFLGVGRLGDSPEPIVNGCKLSFCVEAWDGEKMKPVWLKVLTFGKVAENCLKSLEKGRRISVEGRLDMSKLNNLVIISDNIQFL